MSNQIQLSTFNFNNSLVRTTDINGQVWFLANDVCSILDYSNPRDAIKRHCKAKGVVKHDTPTSSGVQSMVYISEPNLFRLTVKSKKDEAVQFEEWVFEDLLPTIRKTGKYELPKKTTVDQRTPLRDAVNLLVSKKAITYSEAYSIVHQRFNVASIEDLPQDQLPQAIEYVHRVALEGEFIPNQKQTLITMSVDEFYDLAWVCNAARYMYKRVVLITPALTAIESDYSSVFKTMGFEYKSNVQKGIDIILAKTKQLSLSNAILNGRYFPNLEKTI